ncbi:hypothetical protein [Streptomyces sp. NPDC088915]|uniref:hypothetical protein n=1 Tax=Streptomyces sp. NPDC088915 TaxID=3365912 RepID=UPI0037FA7A7F
MRPAVTEAIEDWERAWNDVEEAAVAAMTAAFPPLDHTKTPRYCCDVMLSYEKDGLGSGRLCIDNEGRGTVEFEDIPNDVIAEAIDEVFGIAWLTNADGPLDECGPGTYYYDEETTGAEFEVTLGEDDKGKLMLSYVRVPDAATILDALTRAAEPDEEESAELVGAAT